MNLAIFGGSFNPPQLAHYLLIKQAFLQSQLEIKELILLPNYLSPLKEKAFISSKQKMQMMNLFAKETREILLKEGLIKDKSQIKIEEYEIKNKGKSYTYDTLVYIYNNYKELNHKNIPYLIIGQDNLISFDKWKNYEKILEMSRLLVAKRNDSDIGLSKANLKKTLPSHSVLNIKESNISSTRIREAISLDKKEDAKEMLFNSIYNYIIYHGLYKTRESNQSDN